MIVLYVLFSLVGVYLAFVPLMILSELKRQGDERRAEFLKVVSLLSSRSGPQPAPDSARLQALADSRALPENP